MPSSPQSVATQVVFDYLIDTAGKAVKGVTVNCTLTANGESVTSPVVNIGPVQQSTTTDQNGYWQFNLVPNASLTPANSVYAVQTPFNSYDISVPSSAGPFQSSGIVVNVPSVLSPAVTGLTGPITVTGNESVTGALSVAGTTTLAGTTTGALTTAAASIGGDLTILSAFRLLFGAAVSKLVPGATSFSVRDTADANDNLIVTNAGNVTARGTLTPTGDLLPASRIVMGPASAKIVGGATQLSLRNNADTADNAVITDAGLVTLRNALSIPGAAGIAAVVTSFGSVPILLFFQDMNGIATTTFNTIPQGFGSLLLVSKLRHSAATTVTNVGLRMNNDSTNLHYYSFSIFSANAAPTYTNTTDQTQIDHALISAGTTNADFAASALLIPGYAQTDTNHNTLQLGSHFQYLTLQGGVFTPASAAAITRLDTSSPGANYVAGSKIWVYGLA